MADGSYRKIHRLILVKKMALLLKEIQEAIKSPLNKQAIAKAIQHQNKIKFHAETRVTPYLSQPVTDFITWVESLIPGEKANTFKQLFKFPVQTNIVTGICFNKLSRIFDGRNPAYNYQFMTSEQREDWEYYRQDVLKEPSVWSEKAWKYFQTEHNSILIVDLPEETNPADKYPEPYFYWLSIKKVITYEANPDDGQMNWIIFRQKDKKIAVIDDKSYRVFRETDAGELGELLLESPHDLGYCPAKFFWTEPINLDEPDTKAHPLSKNLDNLQWFLFYAISKRHLDMYGSYPVYSGYSSNCDYTTEQNSCDKGFLRDSRGLYILNSDGGLMTCPKCRDKKIIGPGTFVTVPPPQTKEDPDLRNPVDMLTVDRDSLEYNVEEHLRLKNEIISSVCGTDSELIATQAVNDKQIDANFENQSTILNRIKKGFEDAQTWVDSTICKLRYGSNYFVSAKINLGTDFYTLSVATLREQYKAAKDSGASEAELDAMQNQIIETEYRHNPTQLQRMLVLSELEPFRHLTRSEVLELYEMQLVTPQELAIKLNFSNFVRRFERENTNILEFGTQIPYDSKIKAIYQKFIEYANERNISTNAGNVPST